MGNRLLLFSPHDPMATLLMASSAHWGCVPTPCASADEFRSHIEGLDYDVVLVEGSSTLRQLIGESDPQGDILQIPFAEVERRHILRVLASTGGNKTKAARRLGIDTKTLYNKLKAYGAAAAAQRRRDDGRATADSRFPSPVAKPASECSSCGNPVVDPSSNGGLSPTSPHSDDAPSGRAWSGPQNGGFGRLVPGDRGSALKPG